MEHGLLWALVDVLYLEYFLLAFVLFDNNKGMILGISCYYLSEMC